MAHRPLRFVHASDLHLEAPPHGMLAVADHLRRLFYECSYRAATQVFDAAIAEQADAVLLAGDVINVPLAGAHGIVFLLEQFERLAEHDIPVFWAAGEADPPHAWPACSPLPTSVQVFGRGVIEHHDLVRSGRVVARIVGSGGEQSTPVRPAKLPCHPDGVLTIGVSYGPLDDEALIEQKVHYLALGGSHQRKSISATTHMAHYPGTPQGRSPSEPGPRGCTLVSVDGDRRIKTKSIATDVLRWHSERIEVTTDMSPEGLQELLRKRTKALLGGAGGASLLITWELAGQGPLMHRLRTTDLADQVLSDQRAAFGHQSPAAWAAELKLCPARPLPSVWYEQETILGDVLRAIRQLEGAREPLDLSAYLSSNDHAGELTSVGDVPSREARAHLLHETTNLCVDLLTVPEQHGVPR